MKKLPLLAAAAALAIAAGARADDPPAPPAKPAAPPAPAAGKHENKVSDEAKAAYDKMEKAANCAATKGVKEATGTISTQLPGAPSPTSEKFTFKAPGEVKVEAPAGGGEGGGGGGGRGRGMGRGGGGQLAQNVIRYALGAFRPAADAEYDASVATKDGKSVLTVTMFKDNAETMHTDYALDANGLPATATTSRSMTDRSGQKREMKTDVTFTWAKSGDVWRLGKIESSTKMGENAVTTSTEISYVDAGGLSFPSGWKTQSTMGGGGGGGMETRVGDLVVDGKKIETPKPAEGAEPKKGDKKEKDDDDDEGGGKKEKKGDK
jgi:hypothetical protein